MGESRFRKIRIEEGIARAVLRVLRTFSATCDVIPNVFD
jgi:hypothetical protein